MNLQTLTASDLAQGIKTKKFTAKEVVDSSLCAIRRSNKEINSYITILEEEAGKQAKEVDKKVSKGESLGPLEGVPIAIKDNMMIKGVRTTCASKILGNYIAPYDAFVVEKLKKAGAIFVGKTNMDEFAMGSSTEFSVYGVCRNPWNKELIPGGSSGGSATAVATRTVPLALGSDTGGSIRQPASLCGVLGMKPTYGAVSRYGLVAFASSLDQIGPFANTAEDLASLLTVLFGHDQKDSTSVDRDVPDFKKELGASIKGLKIGVPKEYFMNELDPDVKKSIEEAKGVLQKLGMEPVEISLPHSEMAVAVYYIIAPSEASSNLARYDGIRYGVRNADAQGLIEEYGLTRRDGFGPEVKRRIMIGTYSLSSGYYEAYYAKAQKVRTLIIREFDEAFKSVDVILSPSSPTPAFRIGEKVTDPLLMYLNDIFTIPANLAGIPGLSVPCGFSSRELPIGLQLLTRHFNDPLLIRVADAYLKETEWNKKIPTA